MKSTVEQLSPAERKALALWYDTESYKAHKKLCKLEIEGLGKDALGSQSHDETRFYSGQASMAAKLPKIVKNIYEDSVKDKKG